MKRPYMSPAAAPKRSLHLMRYSPPTVAASPHVVSTGEPQQSAAASVADFVQRAADVEQQRRRSEARLSDEIGRAGGGVLRQHAVGHVASARGPRRRR